MLLVTGRDDDLELRLERRRRPSFAVMVDGDDVAPSSREEVEDVAELARPIGDEQADREEATCLGEPVAEDRDEGGRVDVPT